MIFKVRKRDGREMPFNLEKISRALSKALHASGELADSSTAESLSQNLSEQVVHRLEIAGRRIPAIEEIQDLVEKVLIDHGLALTAKSYILYRAERSRVRDMDNRLIRTLRDITFSDAKTSDLKRENANIDGDTAMGTMLKYGSEGAKHFYELYMLRPEHSQAHRAGDIHIHDLDFYSLTTTCCQIDLLSLFKDGFNTGHGHLREPRDIRSFSALACIAIQSNQNDQHGGQSVANFDYAMARGVECTFRTLYRANLVKSLEMVQHLGQACVIGAEDEAQAMTGTLSRASERHVSDRPSADHRHHWHLEQGEEFELEHWLREIHEDLEQTGLVPSLQLNHEFVQAESQALSQRFGSEEIAQAQRLAVSYAMRETDKATYQAMEALIHNLNSMHSRAGAQTPFSSINYGMDTSPEARMAIRNLLLATEAGLGGGETPIFPIQIFRVKEGVNFFPGEPNYDLFKLACRVSAKRLFPNFAFQDAPFNAQYYQPGRPETEIAYMGCRTRVIGNAAFPDNQVTFGRGNLSFTSINLPRLALLAQGSVDEFYRLLDSKMELVRDQLLERFEVQARKRVRNFPFLMGQGVWTGSKNLDWDDEIREVIRHGTLTLGFIGLAETLQSLVGSHHGQSVQAQELGLQIIQRMRDYCDTETESTGLNFTLIATPAEGLSGRFVRMDRARFGSIAGVTDRDYYTNSFHVPVYHPISAFDKIKIEAPYHALTNAGHITYVELDGNPAQNLDAFEKILRAMHVAGIGYGSINHPVDRDPVCGYSGTIGDQCPSCGRMEKDGPGFERIRRITGYLVGTLERFNDAKQAEEQERVIHGHR